MYDHITVDTLIFHHSMLLDEIRRIPRTVQPADVIVQTDFKRLPQMWDWVIAAEEECSR